MGTNDDWGHNVLYDNSNEGELYAFAMSQYSTLDVTAIGNYWGNNDTAFAESAILHKADQSNLGRVEFEPILPLYPTVEGVSSIIHNGENTDIYVWDCGIDDLVIYTYVNDCDESAPLDEIFLQVPLGVTYTPISDEIPNPVNCVIREITYCVTTPHHDTAIWSLQICVIFDSNKENPNTFTLYPNPVSSGQLNLQNDAASPIDIEVYDMSGKLIHHNSSSDIYTTINVNNWKKGVYLVRIRDNKGITTRKVVVQ